MQQLQEVHVELADDVVRVTKCPPGVRVVIRDYDVEGDDENVIADAHGRGYIEYLFEEEPE